MPAPIAGSGRAARPASAMGRGLICWHSAIASPASSSPARTIRSAAIRSSCAALATARWLISPRLRSQMKRPSWPASASSISSRAVPSSAPGWVLGIVPRQNSSGGKVSLGRITKRGDDYLQTLLIQGARSAVMTAHKRTDRISQWVVQFRERVGWQKATVALANKNARILWAVLTKNVRFNADHTSVKPTVRNPAG